MWNNEKLREVLNDGGIAVMPTDTLYGIVGRAADQVTVERIYTLRKRDLKKPCIILIGGIDELEKFCITLTEEQKNKLREYWLTLGPEQEPRPTSIILDCPEQKFEYLHRSTNTLAFRLPYQPELQELLLKTGPLVAPSVNTEGLPPAENIDEGKKYFGDLVDLYIDGGEIKGKASRVIKLHKDGSEDIIRA